MAARQEGGAVNEPPMESSKKDQLTLSKMTDEEMREVLGRTVHLLGLDRVCSFFTFKVMR